MRHILNMMLVSICLLNVWLVVLGNAEEYPVTDYINTNRFIDYEPTHLAEIRYIVNAHPRPQPEDTLRLLRKIITAIDTKSAKELGKYGIKDYDNLAEIEKAAKHLIDLSEQKCDRSTVEFFVKAIMHVFGRDLKDFVNVNPRTDTEMMIFLRHYGMKELSVCLQSAIDLRTLTVSSEEAKLDSVMAKDSVIAYKFTDKFLRDRANELDLISGKFDGRAMLEPIDCDTDRFSQSGVTANVRLGRLLNSICESFERQLRYRLDIYNLARLFMPEEVEKLPPTDRFLKLNEYSRVCITISDPNLTHALYKNIQKNMRFSLSSCFRH